MTVTPTAFIVIKGEDIRLLQLAKKPGTADNAVAMLPELFDKVADLFKKDENR